MSFIPHCATASASFISLYVSSSFLYAIFFSAVFLRISLFRFSTSFTAFSYFSFSFFTLYSLTAKSLFLPFPFPFRNSPIHMNDLPSAYSLILPCNTFSRNSFVQTFLFDTCLDIPFLNPSATGTATTCICGLASS